VREQTLREGDGGVLVGVLEDTANSSPPSRATVSLGRTTVARPAADLSEELVAGVVAEAVRSPA